MSLNTSLNFKIKFQKFRKLLHPQGDVNHRLKTTALDERFVYCGATAQLGPRQVCRSHSVIGHTTLEWTFETPWFVSRQGLEILFFFKVSGTANSPLDELRWRQTPIRKFPETSITILYLQKRGNPVFGRCNLNNGSIILYVETAGTLRMEEASAYGTWVFTNRQGVIFQEI